MQAKMATTPHMYNLNADPQMCKVIVHLFEKGNEYPIGRPSDDVKVALSGSSIMEQHAVIRNDNGNVYLKTANPDAKVRINGELLLPNDEIQLRQNDRILFGTSHLYVQCDPAQYKAAPNEFPEVTYEMAQDEISACIGLSSAEEKSNVNARIREELADMRRLMDEANSISEELDQKVKFELLVVAPHNRGVDKGTTEVFVKMRDLESCLTWVWSRQQFINRKFLMQEMYEDHQEGKPFAREKNPFIEDPNTDVLIGSVVLRPQCLAYMIDLSQQSPIIDHGGENTGFLNVSLVPLDSKGKEIIDDESGEFIDDPSELVGRKYKVKVKIDSARGLPKRFKDIYVKYDMYLEEDQKTKIVSGTSNPDFKYVTTHQFNPVTNELIKWMKTGNLIFQVWGKQQPQEVKRKMTTKQLSKTEILHKRSTETRSSLWKNISVGRLQRDVVQRRCDVLEKKLHQIRTLVNTAEKQEISSIPSQVIKSVMTSQQPEVMEQALK